MIILGKGTKLYKIGAHKDSIDFSTIEILEVDNREGLDVIKTELIWFFIDNKYQKIDQISAFLPFEGKVLNKIGLGDSLASAYYAFGKCVVNYKAHEPIEYPGILFETEKGSRSPNAIISCISVFDPYKSYAQIPSHISNNLAGKGRKLP